MYVPQTRGTSLGITQEVLVLVVFDVRLIEDLLNEPDRRSDGKADDVVKGALNPLNQHRSDTLDAIPARLVGTFSRLDICEDLGVGY